MRFIFTVILVLPLFSARAADFYSQACKADTAKLRKDRIDAVVENASAAIKPELQAASRSLGLPYPNSKNALSESMDNIILAFPFSLAPARKAAIAIFAALEKALLKNITMPDEARIHADLVSLISAEPGIPADTKTAMIKNVSETRVLLPSQYIAEFVQDNEDLWPLTSRYAEDSAWNLVTDSGKHVILVYPGLLAAEQGERSRAGSLDFVLAHETSHGIDFGSFPKIYDNYTSCMQDRFHAKLNEWDEISADFWGSRVVARQFARKKLSPSDANAELSRDLEILCGTEGEAGSILGAQSDDIHPTGEFRLNHVINGAAPMASLLDSGAAGSSCSISR